MSDPKAPESNLQGQVSQAHSAVAPITCPEGDGSGPPPAPKPQTPATEQQGARPLAGSYATYAKGGKQGDNTPPAERRTSGLLEFLRRVAEGSVVLGALLFVAGWSYLYGYYTTFGVSLGDIDFSAEVILAFSFPVVFSELGSLLLILLGVIYQLSRQYLVRWHKLITLLLVLLFGFTAWGISRIGVQRGLDAAQSDMLQKSSSLPIVTKLVPSSETTNQTALCADPNGQPRKLLLLLHTHESYFFVEPFGPTSESINPKNLTLCVVPQERVRFVLLEVRVQEDK